MCIHLSSESFKSYRRVASYQESWNRQINFHRRVEDDELDNPRVNSDESTPLSMSGWLG